METLNNCLRKNSGRNLNKHLKLVLLLILTLIVLPYSFACGDKTATKTILSNIQGEVLVKRAGSTEWVKAEDQMVLDQGDALKSGTAASAMVTFFDGSIIELKANTQIEIRELVQGKPSNIKLKQELGETISKVGKLVDPASRYEIETPAAIAAVRGSSMLVRVGADGTTIVQNLEGKISVIARGIEVSIPEGGTSTVKPGEPPGPITYSAVDGFITGRGNPNGVWSYGWMPIDFSVFNIYTSHDISVFKKYAPPNLVSWYAELGSDRTPCIWVNTGDPAYGAPTSWLSLHPGPGGNLLFCGGPHQLPAISASQGNSFQVTPEA